MLVVFAVAFISCTEEEDSSYKSPYTEFKDSPTFSANRAAWKEPNEYSFTYDFRLGSTYLQEPVTVTIKDGTATFSSKNGDDLEKLQIFNSIAEIYDYFEKHWQDSKSKKNTDSGISYSVTYSKVGGLTYPSTLNEDIQWYGSGNAPIGAGSAGLLIFITNFTVK